ncbi:MAG: HlyD family efflux transporter periplasmic adaptor subunit [Clostridia bacterium]
MAAFIAIYVGTAVWRAVYDPIQTVSAVRIEVPDAIETDGFIVREEHLLNATAGGAIAMQVGEGERAAKGDTVALIYENDKALAENQKKKELDARISKLESLMNQGSEAFDLNSVDSVIVGMTRNILDGITDSDFSKVATDVSKLKDKTMSREYIYRDKSGLTGVVDKLKAERKKIAAPAPKGEVRASLPGYYSHESDGYEGVLSCAKIQELTPKKIKEISKGQAMPSQNNGTLGKIISEFYWDYVAVVDANRVKSLKIGEMVSIQFSNHMYPEVPAMVHWISAEENGKVTIALRVNEHIKEFTVARRLKGSIVLKTYTGLKVPREALRVDENGRKGVYCLIDAQSKFKEVEPIFEKDSYYIVKYDSGDTKSLLLFDEIVVSAKELADKKVVK